eukprot:SM000189S04081  [mRNA]  locus=s189:256703:264318:+ [translate_table: standard]
MSYAGFRTLHAPTGVDAAAAAFLTHTARSPPTLPESGWPGALPSPAAGSSPRVQVTPRPSPRSAEGPPHVDLPPDLVIAKANMLEIYRLCTQPQLGSGAGISDKPFLQLVCEHRLQENIEGLAVLAGQGGGRGQRCGRRDALLLAFREAKISVLEFDDASHALRTMQASCPILGIWLCIKDYSNVTHCPGKTCHCLSLHYYEGDEWQSLKRGHERFPRGPIARADPLGRCAAVLLFRCQLALFRAANPSLGLGLLPGEEEPVGGGQVSYIAHLRDAGIPHVRDFVFLHGYTEPVAAVLWEAEPAWAGTLPLSKRSIASLSALSLNTSLRQHPIIWSFSVSQDFLSFLLPSFSIGYPTKSIEMHSMPSPGGQECCCLVSLQGLPFDVFSVTAVPHPVGGVLVLGTNSVHHCSQAQQVSLAVNDFGKGQEAEVPRASVTTVLDGAQATWLAPHVALVATKIGVFYLLSLIFDGRAVVRLELSESRASSLPSCLVTLDGSYLFLGSRLGDSLLIQYAPAPHLPLSDQHLSDGNKTLPDLDVCGLLSPASKKRRVLLEGQASISAEEDLLLYSSSPSADGPASSYPHLDRPGRFDFAVVDSLLNVAPLRALAHGVRSATDAGDVGGEGALQDSHELLACSGHGKNGSISVLHRFIQPEVISEAAVPSCQAIWTVYHEADDCPPLLEEGPTDAHHAYLIMSLEDRTIVLETREDLAEVTDAVGYFSEGPTVAVGNFFGRRMVLQVFRNGVRLLDGPKLVQEVAVSGVMRATVQDPYAVLQLVDGRLQLVTACLLAHGVTLSDIDIGPERPTCFALHCDQPETAWLTAACSGGKGEPKDTVHHGYCTLCMRDGAMEIFGLPGFKCVFREAKLGAGPRVLKDSSAKVRKPESQEVEDVPFAQEVCMPAWRGGHSRQPFLLALLSDGRLLCYRAYTYDSLKAEGRRSRLRFVRLAIDQLPCVAPEPKMRVAGRIGEVSQRLVAFDNIGGMPGAVMIGARVLWLMAVRGRLRAHHQKADAVIVAFASLHNVHCAHGFVTVTSQGQLRICNLPHLLHYDSEWPVLKIPLRVTAHDIAYHADSNAYVLVTSTPGKRLLAEVVEQGEEGDVDEADDGQGGKSKGQLVPVKLYEVCALSAKRDFAIEQNQLLKVGEHVTTLRVLFIQNLSGGSTEALVVVGTMFVRGEDVPSKGRVLLYTLKESAEGEKNKLQLLEVLEKEMKGGVTAVASLQGAILLAVGPKLVLHTWDGKDITATAFYDAPLYVVNLTTVKNYVLLGDVHKSISGRRMAHSFYFLPKTSRLWIATHLSSEFLIDGPQLSLVAADRNKNLKILVYAPKSLQSWKGQKLLTRAEFHVGAHTTRFLRIQCPSTSQSKTHAARYALLFGTLDGGVAVLAPVDELAFRRLQALQRVLVDAVPHTAGLNPQAFREYRTGGEAHSPGPDNIVDCDLLFQYDMLDFRDQLRLATQIGSSRLQITASLRDFAASTSFL